MISTKLNLKWVLTPLMLMCLSVASFAQNIQLKGKVVDADTKKVLEAATVVVKNQGQTTSSDANGVFSLRNLKANSTIVVSYIGYTPKTVLINASNENLVIELTKVDENLNEVVVTASDVKKNRPNPDMILYAMDRLNIHNADAIIKVGDSTIDIEEGRNAGCKYNIGVTTGAHTKEQLKTANPNFIFDNIYDLMLIIH